MKGYAIFSFLKVQSTGVDFSSRITCFGLKACLKKGRKNVKKILDKEASLLYALTSLKALAD